MGPKPPVVMMMSARFRASSTASLARWGLSPTTVCQYTLSPRALSPWESIWASVLAMLPSSSSVPTDKISTVWDMVDSSLTD